MAPTMRLHHVWFQTHKALWTRFLLHRRNTVHMIFQCLCLLLLHCTRPTVCRHHTHFKEQYSLSQFSYSIINYWKVTNTVSDLTSYVLCYKNMSLYCPSMSAKYPPHTVTETCGEAFLKFNMQCISEHTNFIHKTNICTLVLWM